jgi:hypothetical protein
MTMPQNVKYGNQCGDTSWKHIRKLVQQEGVDAAAEERIVLRLVTDRPPKPDPGWINTEFMRHRIRKAQGRI